MAADWSPSARAAVTRTTASRCGTSRPPARCSRSSWTASAAAPPSCRWHDVRHPRRHGRTSSGSTRQRTAPDVGDIPTPGFHPAITALHEASGLLALGSQPSREVQIVDLRHGRSSSDGSPWPTSGRSTGAPTGQFLSVAGSQLEPDPHPRRVDGRGGARPARTRQRLLGRRLHRRWRATGQRRLRRRAPRVGRHARRPAGAASGRRRRPVRRGTSRSHRTGPR